MKYKKGDVLIRGASAFHSYPHEFVVRAAVDGVYLMRSIRETSNGFTGEWWLEEKLDEEGYTLKPKECEHYQRHQPRDQDNQIIKVRNEYGKLYYCPDCNSIYLNGVWQRIEE